jgi:hypothetical protein
MDQQVAQVKLHASQLRDAVKAEYAHAQQVNQPTAYREALVSVRASQDQLEEYVAFAISFKGAMARAAADAEEAYSLMWAQEAARTRQTAEDYEGARERYAKFDLKVFAELRMHKQSQRSLLLAGELLDEMWLRYRAVNGTREDLHNILRAYAFETTLDR